jgi:signal transduction histidine kinase
MTASTMAPSAESAEIADLIEEATRRADSEPGRAAELAQRILEVAGRSGDQRALGWGLHLRGWSNFQHGKTIEALEDQLAAVELFRSLGDDLGQGRALAATAPVHDVAGDGATALSYLQQALEIQRRIGDRWGEARTLNGIAIVLTGDEGHAEDGLAMFDDVAAIYEELGDRRWVGFARLNAAQTMLDGIAGRGRSDARTTAHRTLEIGQEVAEIARSLGAEGNVLGWQAAAVVAGSLFNLGDAEEALAHACSVLDGGILEMQPSVQVDLLMVAAKSLLELGRHPEALDRLDQARTVASDSRLLRVLGGVFEQRAGVLEAMGRIEDALASYKRFHDLDARARSDANLARASAVKALLDVQRSEHELALAKVRVEELENASRDRSRLVAAVSHELRTPITSILGLAVSVFDDWNDLGPDARELVGLIRNEAQDLADMVDDLLTVSRVSNSAMKVNSAKVQLEAEAARLTEHVDPSESVPVSGAAVVTGDPIRVRQILRNLVSNARRYGGPRIRMTCDSDGRMGWVEVRDDGSPISAEDQERIFQPFGRAAGSRSHTHSVGLGLWVARELARIMGGDLAYEHDGAESIFRLSLPACLATA